MNRFMILLLCVVLTGCANQPPKALSEGPTMREVLDQHLGGSGALNGPIQRLGYPDIDDMDGYTRDAFNETRNLFPRLPNPDLCFYIYPHLSQESLPVPGYSSCIPLYEGNHYALPGEVGVQPIPSDPPVQSRYGETQTGRHSEDSF